MLSESQTESHRFFQSSTCYLVRFGAYYVVFQIILTWQIFWLLTVFFVALLEHNFLKESQELNNEMIFIKYDFDLSKELK